MASEHIAKSFDDELNQLNQTLYEMGRLVQLQLAGALDAIRQGDIKGATRVINSDIAIDRLNEVVDRQAVRLLALRQPMAVDLRIIVSSLRIASELERMGDYAANLAKRASIIANLKITVPKDVVQSTVDLGLLLNRQVGEVQKSLVERDQQRANQAWQHDRFIDEGYSSLSNDIVERMSKDLTLVVPMTHFLFILKNMERIGDHSTNVAEAVNFIVTGSRLIEKTNDDMAPFLKQAS